MPCLIKDCTNHQLPCLPYSVEHHLQQDVSSFKWVFLAEQAQLFPPRLIASESLTKWGNIGGIFTLPLVPFVWLHRVQFWKYTLCSRSIWRWSRVRAWKRQGKIQHINCFPSQAQKWDGQRGACCYSTQWENLTTESYYWPSMGFCSINFGNWASLDPQCKAGGKLRVTLLFT